MKPSLPPLSLLLLAILGVACTGGSRGNLTARNTEQAVAPGVEIVVRGAWIAYLADESTTGPGGTDLNGDGDRIDSIATVVSNRGRQDVLNVAALQMLLVQEEAYAVVDESRDERDWNGDGDEDDRVLLHWSQATEVVAFVDTIDARSPEPAVASANRVYYASDAGPGTGSTSLRYVRPEAPLTPVEISEADGRSLEPGILGIDEELLFVHINENREAIDLNDDGDTEDAVVIALLDTTNAQAALRVTGLAARNTAVPLRARTIDPQQPDWLVGFLAFEGADATLTGGGFNDPSLFSPVWQPPQCAPDTDLDDDVLFYLYFRSWDANPIANPPVNTGLAGTDRIVTTEAEDDDDIERCYIGTVQPEADQGCDLNEDGDRTDFVARFTEAAEPILPPIDSTLMLPVANLPGGTDGFAELDLAFAAAASEQGLREDLNNDGDFRDDFLAWIEPARGNGAFWRFRFGFDPDFRIALDWLGEDPKREFLSVGTLEEENGPFTDGDDDAIDTFPTFLTFNRSETDLEVRPTPIAIHADNGGIVIFDDYGFYRVDERADNRDWNDDGDLGDMVLFRTNLNTGTRSYLSVLNAVSRPAVARSDLPGDEQTIAFVVSESMADRDFNDDGDKNDWVVRHSRF